MSVNNIEKMLESIETVEDVKSKSAEIYPDEKDFWHLSARLSFEKLAIYLLENQGQIRLSDLKKEFEKLDFYMPDLSENTKKALSMIIVRPFSI